MRTAPVNRAGRGRDVGSGRARADHHEPDVERHQVRRRSPRRDLRHVHRQGRDDRSPRLRRGDLRGRAVPHLRALRARGRPARVEAGLRSRAVDHAAAPGRTPGGNHRGEPAGCRFGLHREPAAGDTRDSTMSAHEFVTHLPRFTSGIPGLDQVLNGGFFAGGVYIVEGAPGAGKTILASQICFHRAKDGQRVLYVTLLAESHARLLQHLQDMSFFDAAAIPEHLTYVSGFRVLEEGGLRALLDLLRRELHAQSANVVVLDGFVAVGESAESDREFKKFVHELQVQAVLGTCTFFLLSSGTSGDGAVQPIHTMVDGLVRLSDRIFVVRAQRELQVQKFRGSRYQRGLHSFEISDDGIRVYPRLESSSATSCEDSGSSRLTIGIPRLDAMIGGGLLAMSTTMILGPSGVGKTVVGYRFLACSTAMEKGLLFSFYETPERVLAKSRGVGIDLAAKYDGGDVELVWQSPVESTLDAIGGRNPEAGAQVRPGRRVL